MQAHADPPDVGALLDAVEAGNMDRVRELLDGGDVGVNDSDEQVKSRNDLTLASGPEHWTKACVLSCRPTRTRLM
jgi:hypothetical protein